MKSKYFTFTELISSDYARLNSLNNYPLSDVCMYNLGKLSVTLDQIRQNIGCPIYVNSGYRSSTVNSGVGGAENSNHMKGLAADITTKLRSVDIKLYEYIKANKSFYNINEVILYNTFIHISIY